MPEPQPPARDPQPDEIHLPGPSLWPPLLSLGLTLLLLGLVFRGVLTAIGAIVFLVALGGWLFEEELARRGMRNDER